MCLRSSGGFPWDMFSGIVQEVRGLRGEWALIAHRGISNPVMESDIPQVGVLLLESTPFLARSYHFGRVE